MKSRSKLLNLFVGFGSLVLIGDATGETYTWTGGAGNHVGWSNPLNWADGLVPVSAADSTILDAKGYQNISPEFDVGTLRNPYFEGGAIRVHQSIVSNNPFLGEYLSIGASISTVGNVTLIDETSFGIPQVGWPRTVSQISRLAVGGPLELSGGWRIDYLQGHGSIHLNPLTSLDAWASNLQLDSLSGSGWFDIKDTVEMVGGVPADLSAGTLDLGRQDNTISYNISRRMTVEGDLKLGEFLIYGIEMVSPIIDRVNVTGELDLTNASIHPESVAQVWSSNVPNFDHFVIATYGNRIGSFPQTTVTYSDWLPIQFEMPIHYTSPENSGPGEVWLVVPEPTSIALVALMVPIALRRRHRKPA